MLKGRTWFTCMQTYLLLSFIWPHQSTCLSTLDVYIVCIHLLTLLHLIQYYYIDIVWFSYIWFNMFVLRPHQVIFILMSIVQCQCSAYFKTSAANGNSNTSNITPPDKQFPWIQICTFFSPINDKPRHPMGLSLSSDDSGIGCRVLL